jgi:teichuronic acid biosynthesis glycosyltransferase TuaG
VSLSASMPVLSVIMPCYNHARFVEESVKSVLTQTCRDLELIVVDDASQDDSLLILKSLASNDSRLKLVEHNQNFGASRSRNDGLKSATGRYIAFCDADDVWLPEKASVQIEGIERKAADVIYSDSYIVDESGIKTGELFSDLHPLPSVHSGFLFNELLSGNFINIQTALLHRKCLAEGQLFDESVQWIEDWWFWIQLSRAHSFAYESTPLAGYRVHSNSTNKTRRAGYCLNRVKVFCKVLSRFEDLSQRARANLYFCMGVDLCALGKASMGRRMLWKALFLSLSLPGGHPKAFLKALRRLVVSPPRIA